MQGAARIAETPDVPPIRERYGVYVAPAWVRPSVERLLRSVPESHVQGIGAVVLTDAESMAPARRSRRSRNKQILGRYHPAWHGEAAWIEVIVDATLSDLPKAFAVLQVSRDLALGRVVFHEIGHHLEATRRGIGRSGESSAIAWQTSLSRLHMQRHYSSLRRWMPLLRLLRNIAERFRRRH